MDLARGLGRLPVGFNPAQLAGLGGERARFEKSCGPKPLVHPDRGHNPFSYAIREGVRHASAPPRVKETPARSCMKTRSTLLAAAMILAIVVPASPTSSVESPVPALPWLHEGLVLTFTWYSAITAGNGADYQEDEHGNWVDP